MPPGVAEENWIPISDDVGIVVTDLRTGRLAGSFDPSDTGDTSLRASGVVMARYRGRWVVFENISALPPRVQPLK